MAVTSQPTVNGKVEETRRRPSPAMVSRGGVIGAMIFILRVIALVLIVASTFGNYVQFMGGWGAYWPINWTIIGLAAMYQLICSLLQWGFKAGKMWLPYGLALLASAIPSFLTYNALFGPYLTTQVGAILTMIGIGIAVIGGDALPEWVLVE
jgi:hypothetical protein